MKKIAKTIILCLIDKKFPPKHAFVDGMLAGVLARQDNFRVRLLVSHPLATGRPCRYNSATCIPALFNRYGFWRILNLWQTWKLLSYQINRENYRGKRVVLFVRNDPIYLFVASLLRRKVSRLIFQSSFPHENYSGNILKRQVAKWIYFFSGFGVDAITGVSPQGLNRIQSLFGRKLPGSHIPLLTDLPKYPRPNNFFAVSNFEPVFVYIGSHNKRRELELIFKAIELSVSKGIKAKFLFIGSSVSEQIHLKKIPQVQKLTSLGVLTLKLFIAREDIPKVLANCHIGICLIPPIQVYYESSPTKLAEYMGAGLAVLANNGIPMQEKFIKESSGGFLVDWDIVSISDGIQKLVKDPNLVFQLSENCSIYAKKKLQYHQYLDRMCELISDT